MKITRKSRARARETSSIFECLLHDVLTNRIFSMSNDKFPLFASCDMIDERSAPQSRIPKFPRVFCHAVTVYLFKMCQDSHERNEKKNKNWTTEYIYFTIKIIPLHSLETSKLKINGIYRSNSKTIFYRKQKREWEEWGRKKNRNV